LLVADSGHWSNVIVFLKVQEITAVNRAFNKYFNVFF